MKNLSQRTLAFLLSAIMAFSTPAAGLTSYAAPTVSDNVLETVVEDSTENETSEETTTNEETTTESSTEEDSVESSEEESSEESPSEETTETISETTSVEEIPETASEELSTEELTSEETSEEPTIEETTEESSTTESISLMEDLAPTNVDLSSLPYVAFDCTMGDVFTAKIEVSENAIAVHHDKEGNETTDPVFYNSDKLYTDSETAVITITPNKDYYMFLTELPVLRVNEEGASEEFTLSPTKISSDTYTYTLSLYAGETYNLNPQITDRYRTISLDVVDAVHADIKVKTNTKKETTGITLEKGYNNRYIMDCSKTDAFAFSIKNSDDYNYSVTYAGDELSADMENMEGYSVYTLVNDTTSANTLLPLENIITITETANTNTLNIAYENTEVDLTVASGANLLAPTGEYDSVTGQESYTVSTGKALTITVKGKENCTIDSIELVTNGTSESVKLKKGTYTFTPSKGNSYTFRVASIAHYLLDDAIYDEDGNPVYAKNKVYTLSYSTTYDFRMTKGASAEIIYSVDITPLSDGGSIDDLGYSSTSEHTQITPTAKAAGKSYELTAYANTGSEDEPIMYEVGTYQCTIAPLITDEGLTITGAKTVNGVTTITQEANATKEYKIKLSSKEKMSSMDVLSAVSSDESIVKASIEDGSLILSANAKKAAELVENATASVNIYDSLDKTSEGADETNGRLIKTINVTLTKSTLEDVAAPDIKLVSATDTTLTLKLTAPKNTNINPTNGFLHYVVFVTPNDPSILEGENPYTIKDVEYWVPVEDTSATVTINVMKGIYDSIDYAGCACDFKVSAALVNTWYLYDNVEDQIFANLSNYRLYYKSVSGDTKIFSTKEPAYATKLNIKQQIKKVYVSDVDYLSEYDDFQVAEITCDKNETYSFKEGYSYSVEDITSDTNIAKLRFMLIDGIIYLAGSNDPENSVGKHTIQVTAPGPQNVKNITKTFTIEVKEGIADISFDMSPTLYKQKGKAVTIKPQNIYVENYNGGSVKKPKLRWSLLVQRAVDGAWVPLDDQKEHPLYGNLTINKNNGTVTLKKNFLVDESENNSFGVVAEPANEPRNFTRAHQTVTITTQKETPAALLLVKNIENNYIVTAKNNDSVTAYDLLKRPTHAVVLKKGAPVKNSYTEDEYQRYFITEGYTTKSNRFLIFESNNTISLVTGAGKKVNITASVTDGSGWKISLKNLNVKFSDNELGFIFRESDFPSDFVLSEDNYLKYNDMIFIPANNTLSYSGAIPSTLPFEIGYATDYSWFDEINWDDSLQREFYNYQVKVKKGSKLISAKNLTSKLKKFYMSSLGIPAKYFPEFLQFNDGSYSLTNMNHTSVIELNDKTNKNKITLTLKNTSNQTAAPKIEVVNTVYANQSNEQNWILKIKDYDKETAGYDTITLTASSDILKNSSTAEAYVNLGMSMNSSSSVDDNGTATFNIDSSSTKIPITPGTYKFTVAFYNGNEPAAIKTIPVTLKIKKRPAVKGSFKPTVKYTINTISENGAALSLEEIVTKDISFAGKFTGKDVKKDDVSTRSLTVNSIRLVNTKGKINNFDDYFDWDTTSGTISLKDTITEEDLAYLKNELKDEKGKVIKSDADRKCYVNYTVTYGMNTNGLPFEKTGTALVTINIK